MGLAIPIPLGKLMCALGTLSSGLCSGLSMLRRILTPGVTARTLLYLSFQGGILLIANRAVQDSIAPWSSVAAETSARDN